MRRSVLSASLLALQACTHAPALTGDGGVGKQLDNSIVCVEQDGGPDPWAPTTDETQITLPDQLGQLTLCEHTASQTGLEEYVIQYVSQAPRDNPRLVTALVYAPNDGQGGHALVALSHATSGMGPTCGPTHLTAVTDPIALPLVAQGYAVVATDYPGMGVDDGVSPYLVGEGEALSVLDSVTAMSLFHDSRFDASQLSGELFLLGHSQGGHATLFAHQLFESDLAPNLPWLGSGELNFLGSVSFAPALGDLGGLGAVMGNAATPTLASPFLPLGLWAFANYYGPPDPSTWLTADAQTRLPQLLHDDCAPQIYTDLGSFATLGSLYAPGFQTDAAGCPFDGSACPAFEPWVDWIEDQTPGNIVSEEPVLIMQGEADTTVLPETTACIGSRIAGLGTAVQLCGYAGADHNGVVAAALGDAMTWMAAVRTGSVPDVCPAPLAESCQ